MKVKQKKMKYLLLTLLLIACSKPSFHKVYYIEDRFASTNMSIYVSDPGSFKIYTEDNVWLEYLEKGRHDYFIKQSYYVLIKYTGEFDSIRFQYIFR